MSFFQEEGEADKPFPVVRVTGCNMSAEQKILVEVLLHTNETSHPNSFSSVEKIMWFSDVDAPVVWGKCWLLAIPMVTKGYRNAEIQKYKHDYQAFSQATGHF